MGREEKKKKKQSLSPEVKQPSCQQFLLRWRAWKHQSPTRIPHGDRHNKKNFNILWQQGRQRRKLKGQDDMLRTEQKPYNHHGISLWITEKESYCFVHNPLTRYFWGFYKHTNAVQDSYNISSPGDEHIFVISYFNLLSARQLTGKLKQVTDGF